MTPTDSAADYGRTALQAAQRARPGDHLCSFHDDDDEQRRLATAFVCGALGAGDRVLYVANGRPPHAVATSFAQAGLEIALRSAQLTVVDFASVYGDPGEMDVTAVLARYRHEADRARAEGYPGLRVAIEMGDFAGALGSVDAVARWERAVTPALADAGIVGLCQYDLRLVGREAEARIAAVHPAVATDDGSMPATTFTATETPAGLAVAGEIDVSTAPALGRALRARAAVSPRVHVNLGAVRFIDVAGWRTVFDVAADLPPGAALVLQRLTARTRRALDLLEWQDPRVQVEDR